MTALSGNTVIVLGGVNGMLGQALVHSLRQIGAKVLPTSRAILDPLDAETSANFLDRKEPVAVFNTVAHTAVDLAEDEPDLSRTLNTTLPGLWAQLTRDRGLPFVHYSTDFVFNGRKEGAYTEEDETDPLSVYGRTKLEGEQAVLAANNDKALILRTAWLFGPNRTNFVQKIIGLAKTRECLSVVHDQVGSPTYTPDLAKFSIALADAGASGIFHTVNSGQASWCELAGEAISVAGINCRIDPIPSSDYPLKAVRPAHSVLDNSKFIQATGMLPRPWSQALRDYVYSDLAHELA